VGVRELKTTFHEEDVTILLKDITGLIEPLHTKEREQLIQKGVHYSEMLPIEYKPSKEYLNEYKMALQEYSDITARAVKRVSEKIYALKGNTVVLISLARAGTPIGILIKRYLQKKYSIFAKHYTISIIRGKGIDHNAMRYILNAHPAESLQFVDGWTGKGAILHELEKELEQYPTVSPMLAVLADPANISSLCGTHDDFLIASACLNATVSGLMSRTFHRNDIIGLNDFHGAAIYQELANEDLTYEFIDSVESKIEYSYCNEEIEINEILGIDEVRKIAIDFNIGDINLIKPGICETTRVLLRRVPDLVLIKSFDDAKYIKHILRLAEEKNVMVLEYPLVRYRSCGIIKNLSPDA